MVRTTVDNNQMYLYEIRETFFFLGANHLTSDSYRLVCKNNIKSDLILLNWLDELAHSFWLKRIHIYMWISSCLCEQIANAYGFSESEWLRLMTTIYIFKNIDINRCIEYWITYMVNRLKSKNQIKSIR